MNGVAEVTSRAAQTAARTACAPLEPPVVINPLEFQRWDTQLANLPGASFFHGTAWPRVLRETYGHEPVYFCRFSGGELKQLLPVMEVSSACTGRRGVSLPFADFCAPLNSSDEDLSALYAFAVEHGRRRNWRHLETRGDFGQWRGASPSVAFFGHALALEGGEAALFKGLDGAMRRGIRKAEQSGVKVEFGSTLESVRIFYALHCRTRRRHGLPPQPVEFFENIARHALEPGHGFVAIARHEQQPVAAAVFFHEGHAALYKYGASDEAAQHLRPNNFLMWEAIRRCAAGGFAELHFGRTSLYNDGLRHFKLGFGAVEEPVEYAKYDFRRDGFVSDVDRSEGLMNMVFRCLPQPLLVQAGRMLYRHLQ
ncbi:MAG TPA: GNAT family N-acetyltransferase [Verrucomicrobiae bacterium]|jgi:CelD/BcsL family acetyltransferase involved in cellulose biosynthesis|nr:GNAT family N-acetyltransferase [Verrucomicrobiae bacterium]